MCVLLSPAPGERVWRGHLLWSPTDWNVLMSLGAARRCWCPGLGVSNVSVPVRYGREKGNLGSCYISLTQKHSKVFPNYNERLGLINPVYKHSQNQQKNPTFLFCRAGQGWGP